MKDGKTYFIENQAIKQARASDILKDGKLRSKRR